METPFAILRLLAGCCCLLFSFLSTAQSVNYKLDQEESEPEGAFEKAAAATGEREEMIARALGLFQKEKYAACRVVLDSAAHDEAGELIVDSISGLAYHMAGMTYYQVYDDANAVPMYLKAIEIRDAVNPEPHIDPAHTRYNLANSMHWMGRPDTATVLLRDAINIYDRMEETDTTNWMRSLKLLGNIARESYDRELTRSATVAATSLLEEYSKPTDIDAYQISFDAMKHFQWLGAYERGLSFVDYAKAAADRLGNGSLKADVINTQGGLHYEMGQVELARDYYQKSIALLKSVDGDPSSIGIAYENLVTSYLEAGDFAEAERYQKIADQYPFSPGVPFSEVDKWLRVAKINCGLGQETEALAGYAQGLVALSSPTATREKEGITYVDPDSLKNMDRAQQIYASRAKYFVDNNRPSEALRDVEAVLAIQDRKRINLENTGSRFAISKESWKYYDLAVRLYVEQADRLSDPEQFWEAFSLSERAKAFSQVAALQQSRRAMGRQEQDLRNDIAALERQRVMDPSLDKEYARKQLRLELHLRAQASAPEPVAERIDKATAIAFLAKRNASLLEYHLSEEQGVAFYLSPTGKLETWSLPPATEVQELVEAFRQAIAEGAYQGKSLKPAAEQAKIDNAYVKTAIELSRVLLPIDLPKNEDLIIVPDGALNYLPFAALITTPPERPVDYTALEYLNTGRELSTTFSLRYLLELEQRSAPTFTDNLLAFAPAFNGKATAGEIGALRSAELDRRDARIATAQYPSLQPLARNQAEVDAIAGTIPRTEAYLGEQATLENFLESIGHQKIIHVASHGLVDPTNPSLSFLAFAQNGAELDESALLYLNDLQSLPLDAELVVLSACETSLGKISPGESVLSLGNAFAYAGARSTISSLWKVDDAATEALMVSFYDALATGENRAAALNQAQMAQLPGATFAHPYYWSGVVLNGATEAVALSPAAFPWKWLLVGLAGMGVLGFAVARRKGKVQTSS